MKVLLMILLPLISYALGVATSNVFYQRKLKEIRGEYSKRLSSVASGAIEYVNELGTQWKEKNIIKSERDKYKKLAYDMDSARKKVVYERDLLRG